MTIRCEIISQDRVVFKGDADAVNLPGTDGDMGILPNHSPLLTTLEFGIITVRKDHVDHFFTVAGGVAEVMPEQVTILADAAEDVEELSESRAEAAKARAEKLLAEGVPIDNDEYLMIQTSLRKSSLRLNAIKRYKTSNRH